MNLIKFWKKQALRHPPFIAKGDEGILDFAENVKVTKRYTDFLSDPGTWAGVRKNVLDVGLYPVPYVGNLKKAKVFILLLNPGLSISNYYAELRAPHSHYKKALIDNLQQNFVGCKYPFISLNPEFSGYSWWSKKLEGVLRKVAEVNKITSLQALQQLSNTIAAIELYPYHSKNGIPRGLKDKIKSSQLAIDYVHHVLLPKARAGKIWIVVARGNKYWDLKKGKKGNVVIYSPHQARGASLGPQTDGGKAICNAMGV